ELVCLQSLCGIAPQRFTREVDRRTRSENKQPSRIPIATDPDEQRPLIAQMGPDVARRAPRMSEISRPGQQRHEIVGRSLGRVHERADDLARLSFVWMHNDARADGQIGAARHWRLLDYKSLVENLESHLRSMQK